MRFVAFIAHRPRNFFSCKGLEKVTSRDLGRIPLRSTKLSLASSTIAHCEKRPRMKSNGPLGPNTVLLRALLAWTCWCTVASSFTVSRQPSRHRTPLNDPRSSSSRRGPAPVHQSRLFGEETEPSVAHHEATSSVDNDACALSRRHWVEHIVTGGAAAAALGLVAWTPEAALASGGATAGRYTYVERMCDGDGFRRATGVRGALAQDWLPSLERARANCHFACMQRVENIVVLSTLTHMFALSKSHWTMCLPMLVS
jgi:hypothetical protein